MIDVSGAEIESSIMQIYITMDHHVGILAICNMDTLARTGPELQEVSEGRRSQRTSDPLSCGLANNQEAV